MTKYQLDYSSSPVLMVLLQNGGSLGEQNIRQVVVIFVLERDADDLPGNISGRVEIFIGHLRHNFLFKDMFLKQP